MASTFFVTIFKTITKTGPKSGSRERLYHFLIQLKEGIFSRPPKSTGQKIERISMCPPPNILSTKSDYFCGRTEGRTDGRTDSVLRPPTYKALRAKINNGNILYVQNVTKIKSTYLEP